MRLSTSEFKLSSKMYICEYAYEWTKDKRLNEAQFQKRDARVWRRLTCVYVF